MSGTGIRGLLHLAMGLGVIVALIGVIGWIVPILTVAVLSAVNVVWDQRQ